jgi:hypothetical protein
MSTRQPPLTAENTLRRVLQLARLDGMSVLVVSGLFTAWSLFEGDFSEAGVGLLVCAAGTITLRGRALLLAGHPRGVNWLIAGQVWLLAVAQVYFLWRLLSDDPELIRQYALPVLHSPWVEPILAGAGLGEDELLRDLHSIHTTSYLIAGVLVLVFQGGLALRYRRNRAAITAALAQQNIPGSS